MAHGEPFDQPAFAAFARSHLLAEPLDVQSGAADVALFRDSLITARSFLSWPVAPRNASGEQLNLVAGFLERMVPNARADHKGGVHCVSINTALFAAINEFALFCFSQAEFFPELGDPRLEVSPSPIDDRVPGIWLLDFTRKGGRVEEEHGERVTPRGQSRRNASLYLALLMVRFVWLHEFQHCLSGHIRFLQERQRHECLNEIEEPLQLFEPEFEDEEEERLNHLIRQCLELDADQSAFFTSVRIQLGGAENIDGLTDIDPDVRLRMVMFSAYAMTWLFEEFQKYLNVQAGQSHPAPRLRLHNLLRTAERHLVPAAPKIADADASARRELEIVARAIPGMDWAVAVARGDVPPETIPPLDLRQELLHALQGELARFRYQAA